MGLDTVEIIMEIEEHFNISISDAEASRVVTVGDLHDLVLRKLSLPDGEVCLTAQAFYRLRRALVEVLGVDRKQVRLDQRLSELLPCSCRRRLWPILAGASGLRMPTLRRPRALTFSLSFVCILSGPCGLLLAATDVASPWACWAGAAALVGLVVLVTRPLAVHLFGVQTVGEFARSIYDVNSGTLAIAAGQVNHREVWKSIVSLICGQLDIAAQDVVNRDTKLVDDLGCG